MGNEGSKIIGFGHPRLRSDVPASNGHAGGKVE
jgi:hypothetical protein